MSLAEGNTRAFIQAFNRLPRPETTPSGYPNYWHITIRTLPMNPPDDLVFLVNLPSGKSIQEGKTKIHSLPSPVAKAKVIAPLLLEAFVASLPTGAHGEPIPGVEAFAPWEWSIRDKKIAKALEKRLKELGVRNDLCRVRVAPEADEDLASDAWQHWKVSLMGNVSGDPMDMLRAMIPDDADPGTVRISSLGGDGEFGGNFGGNFAENSAQNPAENPTEDAAEETAEEKGPDSFDYYRSVARENPEAQELGRSLNLTVGTQGESLYHPVRRLVVTGKDTDENLELFFGPNWKETAGPVHKNARMEVLLRPSPGQDGYELYSRWDKGTPTWSPRRANNVELVQMEKARRMHRGFNAIRP